MITFALRYGTELYLDCIFPCGFRCGTGETGVPGRLRGVSCHDGLDVPVLKDSI